jgi:hypothetical protein
LWALTARFTRAMFLTPYEAGRVSVPAAF